MFPHRLFSCILSCIILSLLVAVQIGAGWVAYKYTLRPFYIGLWIICSDSEQKCIHLEVTEVHMDIIRSFMVMAIFTCFVAILSSVEWGYLITSTTGFLLKEPTAAICNIFTGTLVLMAVVLFEISVIQSKLSEKPKPPIKLWAFYTSCAICVLSYLTGIYGLIIYKLSLSGTLVSQVSPE